MEDEFPTPPEYKRMPSEIRIKVEKELVKEERIECPHGPACTAQNPSHFLKYQHTPPSSPVDTRTQLRAEERAKQTKHSKPPKIWPLRRKDKKRSSSARPQENSALFNRSGDPVDPKIDGEWRKSEKKGNQERTPLRRRKKGKAKKEKTKERSPLPIPHTGKKGTKPRYIFFGYEKNDSIIQIGRRQLQEASRNNRTTRKGSANLSPKGGIIGLLGLTSEAQDELQACSTPEEKGKDKHPMPVVEEFVGEYQLGKIIGKGGFGAVRIALNTSSGQLVAVKCFSIAKVSFATLSGILKEAEILQHLSHPHIVRFYGCVTTEQHFYMLLEFMEGGSLSKLIKSFGPCKEDLAATCMQQVLSGLEYLHSCRVIHRDIKGSNVLLTKAGTLKLADFGIATKLKDDTGRRFTVVGTPYWMAPEVVEETGHDFASDIWSVGSLAHELVQGEPPHYALNPISAMYRLVADDAPPIPADISEEFQDFLIRCWRKDPGTRPSAKELQLHPWIVKHQSGKKLKEMVIASVRKKKKQRKRAMEPFLDFIQPPKEHEDLGNVDRNGARAEDKLATLPVADIILGPGFIENCQAEEENEGAFKQDKEREVPPSVPQRSDQEDLAQSKNNTMYRRPSMPAQSEPESSDKSDSTSSSGYAMNPESEFEFVGSSTASGVVELSLRQPDNSIHARKNKRFTQVKEELALSGNIELPSSLVFEDDFVVVRNPISQEARGSGSESSQSDSSTEEDVHEDASDSSEEHGSESQRQRAKTDTPRTRGSKIYHHSINTLLHDISTKLGQDTDQMSRQQLIHHLEQEKKRRRDIERRLLLLLDQLESVHSERDLLRVRLNQEIAKNRSPRRSRKMRQRLDTLVPRATGSYLHLERDIWDEEEQK